MDGRTSRLHTFIKRAWRTGRGLLTSKVAVPEGLLPGTPAGCLPPLL